MTSKQRMRFLKTVSGIINKLIEEESNGDQCIVNMDIVKIRYYGRSSHVEYVYDKNKLHIVFDLYYKHVPGRFKEESYHNV